MTNVTILGDATRAWVANAADVTVKDLTALQELFSGKLNIIHTTNHGKDQVVIYPACNGDRTEFDAFMERNGAFARQAIDTTRI